MLTGFPGHRADHVPWQGTGPFSRRHQPTGTWLGFVNKPVQAYAGLWGEYNGQFVTGRMWENVLNDPLHKIHVTDRPRGQDLVPIREAAIPFEPR